MSFCGVLTGGSEAPVARPTGRCLWTSAPVASPTWLRSIVNCFSVAPPMPSRPVRPPRRLRCRHLLTLAAGRGFESATTAPPHALRTRSLMIELRNWSNIHNLVTVAGITWRLPRWTMVRWGSFQEVFEKTGNGYPGTGDAHCLVTQLLARKRDRGGTADSCATKSSISVGWSASPF